MTTTPTNSKGQSVKDLSALIKAKKAEIKNANETEKPQLNDELTLLYSERYTLQVKSISNMFAGH